MFTKFIDCINYIEEKILILSFAVTIILITLQIIMRALFNSSLSWSEELARYLFIWQCWIGVSFAERYSGQIQIDFLRDFFKSIKKKRYLDIIANLITLTTSIYLIIIGSKLVISMFYIGSKSTALRIPMYLVYLSMPLGCLIFSIRKLIQLKILLFENKVG